MNQFHEPVLLKEAIEYLKVKPGAKYIDATAGGGGHTFEILARGGKVLAIDRDPDAIAHIKNKVKSHFSQENLLKVSKSKVKNLEDLVLAQGNFSHIREIAIKYGFKKVSGILFDLGVSSHQLQDVKKGFSFQKDSPLDMRMDPSISLKAADIINNFDKRRLNEIFENFGQEKLSRAIIDAITRARQIKPIGSTWELAQIVQNVYKKRGVSGKINPATRVFMALRIVVNSELLNLKDALPPTIDLLAKGGRLVVISFHSLEDGIVKRFFKQEERLEIISKTPIGPSRQEILTNPRSRSAKMRIAQKI